MLDINRLEEVVVFIVTLSGIWLVYRVYTLDNKEKVNQWFTLMALFDILWVDFSFLSHRTSYLPWSDLFNRLNFCYIALLLVSFYYFYIYYFLEEKDLFRKRAVTTIGTALAFLSLFSDAIVAGVSTAADGRREVIFGPLAIFFDLYAVLLVAYGAGLSIRKTRRMSVEKKTKVQYLLFGIILFVLLNITCHVFIPLFWHTTRYAHLGDYAAAFLITVSAFPMTKYRAGGLKAFFVQIILAVMAIILVFDAVFVPMDGMTRGLKITVVLAFLYFRQELLRKMRKDQENMRKVQEINLALAERNMDLKVMLEASDLIKNDLDSRRISQDIVNSIPKSLRYLGYDLGMIILYNQRLDCLYVHAITQCATVRRIEKETKKVFAGSHEAYSEHDDPLARTIKSRNLCTGARPEEIFGLFLGAEEGKAAQRIAGSRSYAIAPFSTGDNATGAIVFFCEKDMGRITPRNGELLQAYAIHVGTSIENAKLYEKAQRQMKELALLNQDLKKTHARLKELVNVKNDFLHITSHQLRTPLTSIRGMISMWMGGDFDPMPEEQRKEMLRRIYVSTDRLNNITNDMLVALELEGGVIKFETKKISLVGVLQEAIQSVQSDYDRKQLYLRTDFDGQEGLEIEGETDFLRKAFVNILDNAHKYTGKGGVTVSVYDKGRAAEIVFSDTGIGMDAEDKRIMFEKFTRGTRALAENPSGSGLGLFIVQEILDEHEGSISIRSDGVGKGTDVVLTLPKKQRRRRKKE